MRPNSFLSLLFLLGVSTHGYKIGSDGLPLTASPGCPVTPSASLTFKEPSNFINLPAFMFISKSVKRALGRIEDGIVSKDLSKIASVFQSNFFLRGCKGVYNKENVIGMLLVNQNEIRKYTFLNIEDREGDIMTIVSATGLTRNPMKMELIYNTKDEQFASATILNCEQPEESFGSVRGFDETGVSKDRSNIFVEWFLSKLKKAIGSKNEEKLNNLFQVEFEFNGCKGVYNRAQVVSMLMKSPSTDEMEMAITESKWRNYNVDIDYTVVVNGFRQVNMTAEFLLNRDGIGKTFRLESGRIPNCPSKSSVERVSRNLPVSIGSIREEPERTEHSKGIQARDPACVTTRFLRSLAGIANQDPSVIEGVVEDNFTFQGCTETYNKADVIEKFFLIPTGTSIALTTARWNQGKVIYTLRISGPIKNDFDSQFVYCPYREQLMSGSDLSCKSRRFRPPTIYEF